ncbi:ABC transporter substrate-binding protein [Cohnella panacarvi]|uniref:ABC transporter substrate-binding protein n=1 Tax=Cohnella panacarvi TaxID=400776 RepID=UPI00047BF5CC|nr:sugar ABC transporter substrate-binding protein [Cohnella panacarvi]
MKKIKGIQYMLIIMAMVVIIAGCTSNSNSSNSKNGGQDASTAKPSETTLSWASWALAEEALKPTYQSMPDSFMESNPDIKIESKTNPYAQYLDQMLIQGAGGITPDVAHIKAEWLPQLMELNIIKPLELDEAMIADYSETSLKAVTIDGKIMAAPWFNNTYALFYNKNLLKKAGITTLPQSWSELMDAAYKISALGKDDSGNKIYGFGVPNSGNTIGEGYNIFPHLWAHGGDFLDDQGNIVINSKENIEAFAELQKLFTDNISPKGATFKDMRNLFGQGVIGFYYDLEGTTKNFVAASTLGEEFNNHYGAMVIPGKDTPYGSGYTVDHLLVAFNSVKDTDALNKFLDHMTGEKSIQILYDAGMGKMSSRSSAMESVFGDIDNELTKTFVKAMETSRSLPTSDLQFQEADDIISKAISELAMGSEVTGVVEKLDKELKKLYGQ